MSGWKKAFAVAALLTMAGSAQAAPPAAPAKPVLTWMTVDLPPATIFDGPMVGRGFADQQLQVLFAALPGYDHQIVKGTIERNWHELETRDGVCFNWVTHNTASHWNAVFSKKPVLNPGYRMAVRTSRLTEFLQFAATGDVDLTLLAKDDALSAAYIASRDYLPAINGFLASRRKLQKAMSNAQLLEMLHANRADFGFASPSEVKYFRNALHLDDDFTLLKVRGAPVYNEGYVACSSGAMGKEVMAKIDAYLEKPEGWAAYVAPLQPWLEPADYAFAAANRTR